MRNYIQRFLLFCCCVVAQVGKPNLGHAQKLLSPLTVTSTNHIADSNEQTTEALGQQIAAIESRIDRIETQITDINSNLKQVSERTPTIAELQENNAELRRMLSNFERFFGALYAEKPEAFDAEAGAVTRMSMLNEYLGNREAELSGLRPAPLTVIDEEATFDTSLLGRALVQISEENSKLSEKVQKLQEKIDITVPKTTNERTGRNPRALQSEDVPDLSQETVTTVEREVAREILSLLAAYNDSTSSETNSSSHVTFTDITDESLTTEEEIDLLTEDLLGIPVTSRRRKSAFSAASMTSMLGSSNPQVVTFDHVYVNKGRDFLSDNHTFVCQIAGFYFISFNLRSYDGRILGVSLMKNDDVMTAIYSDASDRNVMDSQSLILHLERGDRVYLRMGPSEMYAVYSDTRKYTTFSGFLLYRGY